MAKRKEYYNGEKETCQRLMEQPRTCQKWPQSGEQNCLKQKLRESDMSLQNDPNFLTYSRSDFLDTSCLQNVSTRLGFTHIETEYM